MKEETYQTIADAIDNLDIKWLGDMSMTFEEKEKCRKKFKEDWEKICKDNGVTVKEFDIELEKRIVKKIAEKSVKEDGDAKF